MSNTGNDLKNRRDKTDSSIESNFYKFAIKGLPIAVVFMDPDLKIIMFNPHAERLTGYKEDEVLGRHCGDVLKGELCEADCPFKKVITDNKPVNLVESVIHNKWGEPVQVRIHAGAIFDEEGNMLMAGEAFEDISYIKAVEREKGNLISMFAHDMKSALTIIGGFVIRLLKSGREIDEEKRRKYLEIIKNQSENLEALVKDFLDFSRLQTGKLKLNFTRVSIEKELMDIYNSYQLKTMQSGIQLELVKHEKLPVIPADVNQLRRVFTNLLDNAIKFSKERSTITISSHLTSNDVVIKVKDEGIGIVQGELPYIFDPFYRGRNKDEAGGFGLGLAGVRTILKAHGGRIYVESELGRGSIFTVTLPIAGKKKKWRG